MPPEPEGRTITVITGGGGGMGLATAKILGRDHDVMICDVNQERLDAAAQELGASGVTCTTAICDITDRRAVEDLAASAAAQGRVASVVHTAGVSPLMAPPEAIVEINAMGTVNIDEAFLRVADDGFSMVNVASTAGHLPALFPVPKRSYARAQSDPDHFRRSMLRRCELVPARLRAGIAYSLSKNFVIWYSRNRAGAFGERGARIVSVSPGSFDTEMGRLEVASGSGELARLSALKRFGRVEEIAEVLAFCAGAGPGYLTGTDILVDGGADATMTVKDAMAMARKF